MTFFLFLIAYNTMSLCNSLHLFPTLFVSFTLLSSPNGTLLLNKAFCVFMSSFCVYLGLMCLSPIIWPSIHGELSSGLIPGLHHWRKPDSFQQQELTAYGPSGKSEPHGPRQSDTVRMDPALCMFCAGNRSVSMFISIMAMACPEGGEVHRNFIRSMPWT